MTNIWQLAVGRRCRALALRLWPMMVGIAVGSRMGSGFLIHASGGRASTALGVALIAYGMLSPGRWMPAVPPRWERWLALPVGTVTGVVTGATGVFVIPAVPYIGALGLDKEDLVQALGLSFTMSTVALGVSLYGGGAVSSSVSAALVLALLPASIGMAIGQRLRRRIRAATFRCCFFLALSGLGGALVLKSLP